MINHNKNLYLSLLFLLLFSALAIGYSLYLTNYNLTYAIHGPYIHFSMIKHLATQGILSVDGFSYSSVSSSPLWLILLTPFYKFLSLKIFIWIPLILNILFQMVTLVVIYKIVDRYTNNKLNLLFLILIVLITPFLALSFGGLEHSLQIMLITLFLYNYIGYINNTNENKYKNNMLIIAPFIVACRYEDLAFISSVSLFSLIYYKDIRFSIKLFLSSLILIAIFGIWSELSFDLGFVPSSITAKSSKHLNLLDKFLGNLFYAHIIANIFLNILIFLKSFKRDKVLTTLTSVYILTFIVHLAFAKVGWLYRYEAYLIIFGLINIVLCIYRCQVEKRVIWFLSILFILSNYKQILFSPIKSVLSTKAVYLEQIQEGLFAKELKDEYIATDNIGTVPLYSNNKILDIHGLSNPKIIELKNRGIFNDKSKKELIENSNADLIIAYKNRFKDPKIDNYTKIATWKIAKKMLNGDDEIVIYAKKSKISYVMKKLKSFIKNKLPKDTKVIWNIQNKI